MDDFKQRTKAFALRIIKLYGALPKSLPAQVIGKQILRSGTSDAANIREASRSRSQNKLLAKLGLVEQELDETLLWPELLVESDLVKAARLNPLIQETEELLKIVVASIKTTRNREKR